MRYEHVTGAVFLDRPNRFTAHVELNDQAETVHVKNTGRCRELLLPGAEVYLAAADKADRKTKYDLIAVRRTDGKVVNIDSQAPNQVVYEWLCSQGFQTIIPEYRYGESRIDFFMARGKERYLMEVKGCTLEIDGVGYFPDAPTERGVKHVRELGKAAADGFHAVLAFVIPMDGVKQVKPNMITHPEFGRALYEAKCMGMRVLFLPCHAEPDSLSVTETIWEDASREGWL